MDFLREYINSMLSDCDGELGEIQKYAYENGLPIIPKEVVKLLEFVLSVKRPQRVLEIGACIGFSSSLMSGYIQDGGHVTTIDRFDIMIKQAKENYKKLKLEDKITLIEKDASDALKELCDAGERYDFIFMDAAKGQYINFLPYCLEMLNLGGIIMADDTLQEGWIAKDRYMIPRRHRTIQKRMREFLWQVCNNKALKTSVLTIGDGVVLCHKVGETNGLIEHNEDEFSQYESALKKLMLEKEPMTERERESVIQILPKLAPSQRKTVRIKLKADERRKKEN